MRVQPPCPCCESTPNGCEAPGGPLEFCFLDGCRCIATVRDFGVPLCSGCYEEVMVPAPRHPVSEVWAT